MAAPTAAPTSPTRPNSEGNDSKGLPELGRELLDLTVAYAKQETIGPLKGAQRTIGWGVAGATVSSIGLLVFVIGVVRVVQVEARLRGAWSWVPYAAGIAVTGLVAFISMKRIQGRGKDDR